MAIVEICDLEDRVGGLTPEQKRRAPALIGDAVALIEAWCGLALSERTSSVTLRPNGSVLVLPFPPIQSVEAVRLVDSLGNRSVLVSGGWVFDGVQRVRVDPAAARWVVNMPESVHEGVSSYEVDYVHGYADGSVSPALAAVRMVVANMVNRTVTAPSVVDGMVGETIGQYSYQLQQGRGGAGGGVSLSSADRLMLREMGLRPTSAGSVETPVF